MICPRSNDCLLRVQFLYLLMYQNIYWCRSLVLNIEYNFPFGVHLLTTFLGYSYHLKNFLKSFLILLSYLFIVTSFPNLDNVQTYYAYVFFFSHHGY